MTEHLCSDLAREMRRRWQAGERPTAEEFIARDPELARQPEAAVELIYEEYCLREAAGEPDAAEDILRRFPQWAGPLQVMFDCHRRVLQSQRDRPRFPHAGDRVGDFRLTAELSRGARGRVFLATEATLADRPVVLKITPLDYGESWGEHLSLARLQHTNIVPLYSVVDEPVRNIRILCMPYFGRATLASMLESVANVPPGARTGRHIVDAIDGRRGDSSPAPPPPPTSAAARQMLANVSYVQAMCWLAACVADALHFAHERGLVHLDLKPSNVLLATDGQPMLLDFHLARAPLQPNGPLPENIGGTLPYMPAEQRAAMQAIQNGEPVETPVDGRADIYALGAMLYESLGGQLPIDAASPPLSQLNPQVSAGLSDVIARCIADRSSDRYADAAALAADLRRHLTDQPLAGVPNRSIRERWEKWRRRRPGALRAAAMLGITIAAAAALTGGAWLYVHDRHEQAEVALSDGQAKMLDAATLDQAMQSLERGIGLLRGIPFQSDLRAELRHLLVTAERMQLARHLHHVAGKVRVLYGDSIPPHRARSLATQCAALWRQRGAIVDSECDAPQLADDFRDVAIFAAHISGKDEATSLLDEVEREFGRSAVLDHERHRHGLAPSGTDAPPRAANSAWEHYALGRSLLAADDLLRASDELAAAVRLDPAGCWPNFYYGLCAYRMGRHEDAIAAFSVCIGTSPDVAGCFYNRALAYNALSRTEQALADYDRALQIDPTHAAAALNRGMMHFAQRDVPRAIADLNAALTHGADAATVHYDLAVVYLWQDDRARALEHAGHALETNPAHDNARKLRDSLRGDTPAVPQTRG